jgi:ATP-dependent DNA helicase RecQ
MNWSAEYVPIGSSSSLFSHEIEADPSATRLLSQTLLLQSRHREPCPIEDQSVGLLAVVEKILLRGRLPLPTLALEREALRANRLDDLVEEIGDDAELGWGWRAKPPQWSDAAILARRDFEPSDELAAQPGVDGALLDSQYEGRFLQLVAAVDGSLPHWLLFQVPLSNLLVEPAAQGSDDRRVDFVLCHPKVFATTVIEIDGPEHEPTLDAGRDRLLISAGYRVVRIPNAEIESGHGPALDALLQDLKHLIEPRSDVESLSWWAGRFSLECAWGAKLQFAVVRALQVGMLTPTADAWQIQLHTPFASSFAAIEDLLNLLHAVEQLYEGWLLPGAVNVYAGDVSVSFHRSVDGWRRAASPDRSGDCPEICICLEPDVGPWAADPDEPCDLVVRTAFAPRDFSPAHAVGSQARLTSAIDFESARAPLTHLLRTIFRKQDFREGQAEAVYNAVRGDDAIVLLPTGGGKSIIYQLSGLLSPGITLVIDPLVSLIEDQIRGLKAYGIDRAVGISSATGYGDERTRLLRAAERGEFMFILVAPERMQSPSFRGSLRAMAQVSRINVAVIDEAHCVSEWGHDFRPAYLNLARNLRRLGETEGRAPTILALTGTASRAVLRDMVADLELDARSKNAIVRPASFDRKELTFRIVETDGRNAQADFRGALMSLPQAFRKSAGDFYTPSGRHTYSGVVFTSFSKSTVGGVFDLREQVRQATGAAVTVYSGGSPHMSIDKRAWDVEKRENARKFMQNEVPVLVATKAFGMGIDKPNIRYTLHYGMPGSLEAFYQEAGRAGRDRRPAQCVILYSRPEPQIEAKLDVIRNTLPDLREAFENAPRQGRGDLGSALFFHLNSFKGPTEEKDDVKGMVDRLANLVAGESTEIPFARTEDGRKREEKALFRLVQAGFLADYEVDFGGHKYRVVGGSKEPSNVAQRVIAYVRRSDSGRVADIESQLKPFIRLQNLEEATVSLIGVLIDFCYDTIERARRRSIFEAMEAAKQGRDPSNFRRRLLDYLQEGMDPESFQRLVESESISFAVCREMLAKTNNEVEAGELRGITIRFLESYPDHPALLVLRALSESLTVDCDDAVTLDSLRNLLGSSVEKYSVKRDTVDEVIELVAAVATTRSPRLFPALLLALEDTGYTSRNESLSFKSLARRGMSDMPEEVTDILLIKRLQEGVNKLRGAASAMGSIN